MNDNALPPLSLYVHLPWCKSKCPYCDFNSHTAADSAPTERYLKAVETDLRSEAKRAGGRPLLSVYIGGGTPSFFTPAEIGLLIEAIRGVFELQQDLEVSMEANPGTVERGNLRDYRSAGVNRLSLGAQSFNSESLKRLGRIHGPGDVYAAFDEACGAGFDSINLDLMFGLPGQDVGMAIDDVERVTKLEPQHISYYQLTLEPITLFHSKPPEDLPDEEQCFALQSECHALLSDNGYEQYEVSAFARPGFRCRHNLNYWTFGDYLAAGAGAHGKITGADGRILRYEKVRHPVSYMERAESGVVDCRQREVRPPYAAFEFMLNALRLPDGFTVADYTARTGLAAETIEDQMARAARKGMIESIDGPGWRPTTLGARYLNDLTAMFLP